MGFWPPRRRASVSDHATTTTTTTDGRQQHRNRSRSLVTISALWRRGTDEAAKDPADELTAPSSSAATVVPQVVRARSSVRSLISSTESEGDTSTLVDSEGGSESGTIVVGKRGRTSSSSGSIFGFFSHASEPLSPTSARTLVDSFDTILETYVAGIRPSFKDLSKDIVLNILSWALLPTISESSSTSIPVNCGVVAGWESVCREWRDWLRSDEGDERVWRLVAMRSFHPPLTSTRHTDSWKDECMLAAGWMQIPSIFQKKKNVKTCRTMNRMPPLPINSERAIIDAVGTDVFCHDSDVYFLTPHPVSLATINLIETSPAPKEPPPWFVTDALEPSKPQVSTGCDGSGTLAETKDPPVPKRVLELPKQLARISSHSGYGCGTPDWIPLNTWRPACGSETHRFLPLRRSNADVADQRSILLPEASPDSVGCLAGNGTYVIMFDPATVETPLSPRLTKARRSDQEETSPHPIIALYDVTTKPVPRLLYAIPPEDDTIPGLPACNTTLLAHTVTSAPTRRINSFTRTTHASAAAIAIRRLTDGELVGVIDAKGMGGGVRQLGLTDRHCVIVGVVASHLAVRVHELAGEVRCVGEFVLRDVVVGAGASVGLRVTDRRVLVWAEGGAAVTTVDADSCVSASPALVAVDVLRRQCVLYRRRRSTGVTVGSGLGGIGGGMKGGVGQLASRGMWVLFRDCHEEEDRCVWLRQPL